MVPELATIPSFRVASFAGFPNHEFINQFGPQDDHVVPAVQPSNPLALPWHLPQYAPADDDDNDDDDDDEEEW